MVFPDRMVGPEGSFQTGFTVLSLKWITVHGPKKGIHNHMVRLSFHSCEYIPYEIHAPNMDYIDMFVQRHTAHSSQSTDMCDQDH